MGLVACHPKPKPACGNAKVEAGEDCDDGNQSNSDACLNTCEAASCGDGYVWAGKETCDDGVNDGSYNGCAPGCDAFGPFCGDGEITNDEQCDDGNKADGDGCSSSCEIEALYCCEGEPSECEAVDELEGSAEVDAEVDDGDYDGSIQSMVCANVAIALPSDCGPMEVGDVSVELSMEHAWIGDLTIKAISPDDTITTLLSRPGLAETADDGTGCCGDSSNLLPAFPITFADGAAASAEQMGAGICHHQVVCRDDNRCTYDPNPGAGPGEAFEDYEGERPQGTWRLCIGDSRSGNDGFINTVGFNLGLVEPSP